MTVVVLRSYSLISGRHRSTRATWQPAGPPSAQDRAARAARGPGCVGVQQADGDGLARPALRQLRDDPRDLGGSTELEHGAVRARCARRPRAAGGAAPAARGNRAAGRTVVRGSRGAISSTSRKPRVVISAVDGALALDDRVDDQRGAVDHRLQRLMPARRSPRARASPCEMARDGSSGVVRTLCRAVPPGRRHRPGRSR